jgi:hypothetical protein
MKFIFLLCVVVVCGCAQQRPSLTVPPMFNIESRDVIGEDRFELTLQSQDKRAICLDVQNWPNDLGGVHYGADFVQIVHNRGVLPIRDLNLGYCSDGCGVIVIPPGSTIRGSLTYAEFGSVAQVRALEGRVLEYSLSPRLCTRQDKHGRRQ